MGFQKMDLAVMEDSHGHDHGVQLTEFIQAHKMSDAEPNNQTKRTTPKPNIAEPMTVRV